MAGVQWERPPRSLLPNAIEEGLSPQGLPFKGCCREASLLSVIDGLTHVLLVSSTLRIFVEKMVLRVHAF